MTRRAASWAEFVAGVLLLLVAVWCWDRGVQTSEFAPVIDGAPTFKSTYYSGSWITCAFALATVAGIVVIDGVRRMRIHPKDDL